MDESVHASHDQLHFVIHLFIEVVKDLSPTPIVLVLIFPDIVSHLRCEALDNPFEHALVGIPQKVEGIM